MDKRRICFKCKSAPVCKVMQKIYKAFDDSWCSFDGRETLNDEIHLFIASHCKHYNEQPK